MVKGQPEEQHVQLRPESEALVVPPPMPPHGTWQPSGCTDHITCHAPSRQERRVQMVPP